MTAGSPPLPLIMPDGQPVPARAPVPGRPRTNEDWKRESPESYEAVVERILSMDLNWSALAEEFRHYRAGDRECLKPECQAQRRRCMSHDAMRRAIHVLAMNDPRLGLAKIGELRRAKLELTEAQLVDKVDELGAKATKADQLGAVAMSMKLARDTLNSQGGAAVVVVKHQHTVTIDDTIARRRDEIRQRLAAQSEQPTVEAEVVEIGGFEKDCMPNASDQATASK